MKNLYCLFLLFTIPIYLSAQNDAYKKEIANANELLLAQNYNKALLIYDNLLKQYPNDPFIFFKAGECFLFSEERIPEAINLLEKAAKKYPINNSKENEGLEVRFYLGQAYHLNNQFEEALETYMVLKKQIPSKRQEAISKVEREITYCQHAIALKKNPVEFKITNLGPLINTEFDEHSPVINVHEDLLMFTSNRETEQSLQQPSGLNDENVYYSIWREGRWITSRAIDINTKGNNATIGISPDGNILLIYQNDGAVGNIYTSVLKHDKWGELEKMPAPINSIANETHASFSMDNNTLYFTSDRAGGYGGKDIYKVSKLPNGEWGKEMNLGPQINTAYDEESPYLHPNEKTLYFSSEGHESIGGFDIFKASLDSSGLWNEVTNIGYPINTTYDDLFYAPTADEQRVYYASKRNDGYGGSDIYLIEFPDDSPSSLTVVGGYIFTKDGNPAADATIYITNKKTGKKEGVYRPSPLYGKYIFIIPADNTYQMELKMDGYKTVLNSFIIPPGRSYARKGSTFFLDPIVLEPDN